MRKAARSACCFFLARIFLWSIIKVSNKKEDNYENISNNELYISEAPTSSDTTPQEIIIHIDGEVQNPGIVHLPVDSRISDAIGAAGGTTILADTSKLNLAYQLKDGQKVGTIAIIDKIDIENLEEE